MRYAEAMKGRKKDITDIKGEFWLLDEKKEAELDAYYKSTLNEGYSENNGSFSENNLDNSEINSTNKIKLNKTKSDEIKSDEVSKKESSKKEINQSYDEIFETFGASQSVKEALINFIRHLKVNGTVMINDRLESLLVGLDLRHREDDIAKCREINDAIAKGYKRLPWE